MRSVKPGNAYGLRSTFPLVVIQGREWHMWMKTVAVCYLRITSWLAPA